MPKRRDKFGKKLKPIPTKREGRISAVYQERFRETYDDQTAEDVQIPPELTKMVHILRRSPIEIQYIRDLIEQCETTDPQTLALSKANHLQYTLAKISKLIRDVEEIDNPQEIDCNELTFRSCVPQELAKATPPQEVMDIEVAKRVASLKMQIK